MWRNSTLQTLGFGNLLAFDSVHKWTHLHCRIHVEEQSLHETHLRHLASRDDALRTSPKDGACEYLNIKSSNWIYIVTWTTKIWSNAPLPVPARRHSIVLLGNHSRWAAAIHPDWRPLAQRLLTESLGLRWQQMETTKFQYLITHTVTYLFINNSISSANGRIIS